MPMMSTYASPGFSEPPLLPIPRKMDTVGGASFMGSFINVSLAIPASGAVADEVHYSSSFLAKNGAKLSHQQPLTVDGEHLAVGHVAVREITTHSELRQPSAPQGQRRPRLSA